MIPTIETKRLRLVPPKMVCFDAYVKFYTDEGASKMYGGPIGKEQVWARLKADIGSWHLLGFGVWAIQLKSDDSYIGTCGFWQGRDWPKELTWWVLPEAREKGIAAEASIAAVSHAFNEFKWEIVETYMNDKNTAAKALVEKLGGKKSRRETFNDGLSRDIYTIPKPAKKAD
ncbi:GNAT family N-acetyltransferase [Veronia nyctiphanis]|uniref:GNAT family N-acetyltransferase n=1 Tax=Veronia nyctiphanis TaxID=1278244 RepID=A0A4Q0YQ18_9GAMM|nr:GNAT family N-acetyltransferase [Veronia nyctiphanis]RXJ73180.1 GNAT family N-acetyltransferase [Veronia nyctiphanis]